jgi:hypothetical protein
MSAFRTIANTDFKHLLKNVALEVLICYSVAGSDCGPLTSTQVSSSHKAHIELSKE